MATARRQIVAWESRFFLPVGLAAFAAAILIIVSNIVVSGLTNNGHESSFLISAHENGSTVVLYAALQAIGFLLLMAPLYFLFRATAARSDQFRSQLVGVVIAAPIFFAIAAIITGAVTLDAAGKYVDNEVKATLTAKEATTECRKEQQGKGSEDFAKEYEEGSSPLADCEEKEVLDSKAKEALNSSGLQGLGFGFGLAGRLGFAVALLYTCLYAMRVGLLSRFWGSLGMALGVASLILAPEFALIFFVYFGLLAIGKIPGGRPPAWPAGEAVPWPSPGEKVAEELQPEDPEADVIDAEELPEDADISGTSDDSSPPERHSRNPRKRKRRS